MVNSHYKLAGGLLMGNLKQFLFKYKHAIIILYIPIYMAWFILLEKRTDVKFIEVHCIIDDFIPFCEIFIIPYLLWFIYVAASLVFLFFQTKYIDNFYKCAAILVMGMTTSLIIYTFFPNAQNMRPDSFERENIFTNIISVLYAADTDTNVCPSIHVYNSIAIHVSIATSQYFKDKKWIKNSSLILCILICMSTLFLKQHSFIDLICAAALYIFYYNIIYRQVPLQYHIHYKTGKVRRFAKSIKHHRELQ